MPKIWTVTLEYNLSENLKHTLVKVAIESFDKQPAKHFIGVQPMQGPVGLIYSLRYKIENEDGETEFAKEADFDDLISGGKERRMALEIISEPVEASTHKLQARWTLEAMQDVNAQHGLDFEEELVQILSAEINKEIYDEILADLSAISTKKTIDMSKIMDDPTVFTSSARNMLAVHINHAANEIARKTRRGAGNFIIASEIITDTISGGKFFEPAKEKELDYGYVKYVGKINGNINVYCDYTIDQDKAIIGYKGGSGETDAGYFYAPYVPVMSSGVVVDPTTFQPLFKFMARYGKHVIRDEVETKDSEGKETIVKEPSNYYVEITFDNMPEEFNFKVETEEEKEVLEKVDSLDAFEAAMELLD